MLRPPGTIISADGAHVRGRNCVLNGNHGVLHDGDGATINGDHWIVFCEDPASVVDNGRNNNIIATGTLDTARFEGCDSRGYLKPQPRQQRPMPTRVTIVWLGEVVAVYDARKTVAARIEAARRQL